MERWAFINGGLGFSVIGFGIWVTNGCKFREVSGLNAMFSDKNIGVINEIDEAIIPPTDMQAANAANVGEYIAIIIQDWYAENEKKDFKGNLEYINRNLLYRL